MFPGGIGVTGRARWAAVGDTRVTAVVRGKTGLKNRSALMTQSQPGGWKRVTRVPLCRHGGWVGGWVGGCRGAGVGAWVRGWVSLILQLTSSHAGLPA